MAVVMAMGAALGLVAASALFHPAVRLTYNASDSAPRGLYLVLPLAQPRVGDIVLARLPGSVARFAATRHYLPETVPVLKRVAAVKGDFVCRTGDMVYVNQIAAARVLAADSKGRPLPNWMQCRALLRGELFLLGVANLASFDSRYFGPIDASFVRGSARPLLIEPSQ